MLSLKDIAIVGYILVHSKYKDHRRYFSAEQTLIDKFPYNCQKPCEKSTAVKKAKGFFFITQGPGRSLK